MCRSRRLWRSAASAEDKVPWAHYVNGIWSRWRLMRKPEAMIYEQGMESGTDRRGVRRSRMTECAIRRALRLMGQSNTLTDTPNRYGLPPRLHVGLEGNPKGMFVEFNLTCRANWSRSLIRAAELAWFSVPPWPRTCDGAQDRRGALRMASGRARRHHPRRSEAVDNRGRCGGKHRAGPKLLSTVSARSRAPPPSSRMSGSRRR